MEITKQGDPHIATYCHMDNEVVFSLRMPRSQPGMCK